MQQEPRAHDARVTVILRRSGAPYLVCFVLGFVLGGLSTFVVGTQAVLKGQSLAVLAPLVGSAAALALWAVYRPTARRGLRLLPLIGLLVLWLGATLRAVEQASGFNYTVFLVPLILVMIMVKPPSQRDVEKTGRAVGVIIGGVAAASLIYSFASDTVFLPPEYEMVYDPVNEFLGFTKRWVGPFFQENYAGPIAALVLIFALYQRGWYRWVMGIAASWMVFASTSSTAFVGVAVGLLVLASTSRSGPWSRVSGRVRVLVALLIVMVIAIISLARDPSFNGRTTVWSSYWEVWHRNPLGGVGTLGIEQALRDGTIPLYWTHAHNWFLDALVRYGVFGLILVSGIAGVSLYLTGRAAVQGTGWPLAIVVAFLTMGLLEVPGDWLTWNLPVFWFVLAVLATEGSSASRQVREPASGIPRTASL